MFHTGGFDKLDKVVDRYNDIERQMAEPDVLADHVRMTELAQERTDMGELVETYQQYMQMRAELAQAEEMSEAEEDEELAAMATRRDRPPVARTGTPSGSHALPARS
jgi:peptide chain release factor 1